MIPRPGEDAAVTTKALSIALGALLAVATSGKGGETPPMQIDHILIGASDLDRAVAEFRERTGVEARFGGKHPYGTHNALVSLGDGVYLELIAPQPGATPDDWLKELLTIQGLKPFGWAVTAPDGEAARRELAAAGLPASPPQPGSRATPDGATLRWETFTLADELAGAPFFITWAKETPHPSTTSPAGCRLESLTVRGPDVERLARLASKVRQKVVVERAASERFTVTLSCPKGEVTFDAP